MADSRWKNYYRKNRRKVIARVQKAHLKIQEQVLQYLLTHPCVDCGEKDPVVLQFDHVRGKKKFCIGNMMLAYGWKMVLKEIKKCKVRCSNCHDRRTARQRKNFRWRRTLELGLR